MDVFGGKEIRIQLVRMIVVAMLLSLLSPMSAMAATYEGDPEWIEYQDSYRINRSPKTYETRLIDGYEITLTVLYEKDGQSTFLGEAKNVTEEDRPVKLMDIYFYDEQNQYICVVGGIIGDVKPGGTTQINASATWDLAIAYDWEMYFADEETGIIPTPVPTQTQPPIPTPTFTPTQVPISTFAPTPVPSPAEEDDGGEIIPPPTATPVEWIDDMEGIYNRDERLHTIRSQDEYEFQLQYIHVDTQKGVASFQITGKDLMERVTPTRAWVRFFDAEGYELEYFEVEVVTDPTSAGTFITMEGETENLSIYDAYDWNIMFFTPAIEDCSSYKKVGDEETINTSENIWEERTYQGQYKLKLRWFYENYGDVNLGITGECLKEDMETPLYCMITFYDDYGEIYTRACCPVKKYEEGIFIEGKWNDYQLIGISDWSLSFLEAPEGETRGDGYDLENGEFENTVVQPEFETLLNLSTEIYRRTEIDGYTIRLQRFHEINNMAVLVADIENITEHYLPESLYQITFRKEDGTIVGEDFLHFDGMESGDRMLYQKIDLDRSCLEANYVTFTSWDEVIQPGATYNPGVTESPEETEAPGTLYTPPPTPGYGQIPSPEPTIQMSTPEPVEQTPVPTRPTEDETTTETISVQPTQLPEVSGVGKTLTLKGNVKGRKNVVLRWQKVSGTTKYLVCRATKKKGMYKQIANISKNKYTDSNTKKGKKYYYKIVAVSGDGLELASSNVVPIAIDKLLRPKIAISKGVSASGQKYVQIKLRKCEGTYAEIWMKSGKKYQRLKVKSKTIRAYGKRYRFAYQSGGKVLRFKVRTYDKQDGKRAYSQYSKTSKIRI